MLDFSIVIRQFSGVQPWKLQAVAVFQPPVPVQSCWKLAKQKQRVGPRNMWWLYQVRAEETPVVHRVSCNNIYHIMSYRYIIGGWPDLFHQRYAHQGNSF